MGRDVILTVRLDDVGLGVWVLEGVGKWVLEDILISWGGLPLIGLLIFLFSNFPYFH